MDLSADLQRDLHGHLRRVEEEGRALLRRIEDALGFGSRKRIKVAQAKLDILVNEAESLIFPDPEVGEVDREIEELNDESDKLFLQRAALDRRARSIRRESDRIALDRRALDNRHVQQELAAVEERLGPLGRT